MQSTSRLVQHCQQSAVQNYFTDRGKNERIFHRVVKCDEILAVAKRSSV